MRVNHCVYVSEQQHTCCSTIVLSHVQHVARQIFFSLTPSLKLLTVAPSHPFLTEPSTCLTALPRSTAWQSMNVKQDFSWQAIPTESVRLTHTGLEMCQLVNVSEAMCTYSIVQWTKNYRIHLSAAVCDNEILEYSHHLCMCDFAHNFLTVSRSMSVKIA